MKNSSKPRFVLLLVCIAAFLANCTRDPNVRKQKYFESGQRYYAKGKYREAIIEYRNATEVDATYADAHYELAHAYIKLQDWQHAYSELSRTVELQPDNYKARGELANLLISDGEPDKLHAAQDHVDLLMQKQPNDADTHIVAANLLTKEQRLNDAIQQMQKALSLAPTRGDIYYDMAVLQTQANLPDAAEANYKKAIELKVPGIDPRLALAALYQSKARYSEAEQQIQHVIAEDPKNTDARAALARLYMSEGKRDEAVAFLQQVKQEFPDNSVGYRMLGDFYFATGDFDKAINEYQSLYNDHPKDLQVKKNYIQLLILKNRVDEASKLNDQVLKEHPSDEEALVYRGEIQLNQGKAADAVQTLQSVTTSNPGMAVAHYQLGLALQKTGDMDRAGAEWRSAVQLSPNMVEAQRMLALYAIQKSDMSGLEDIATKIIQLQPTSPDGYVMRAVALMAQHQFPGAEQDARKAIQVAPQAASGYLQMGNVTALQLRLSESESWYKQALGRDKTSVDALRGLINLYLGQKQLDKALAAVNQQIIASPNSSPFYDLLGIVQFNKKDNNAALAAFKQSVELDKTNTDAYIRLGRLQTSMGALDDAVSTCNNGARDNPKEASFYTLLGSVYEKKHDLGQAKDSYQKALQLKADDPLTSNNLAYVLLETNGNPDLALQLAQTARRGLPEKSFVADTLGWAFYQKGIYDSAIGMFQEAIKLAQKNKEPDNPDYHYHLGLAYAKVSKPALAKEHLERVLKIDPNYSDAAQVRKELAQLKS